MKDDELRKAMRRDVPPPRAGYWDQIDATLEAAAGGQRTSSESSSGEMETDGEVIRLMVMSEQQPTSTNSSRILLAAAALIAVVGVGIVAFAVRGNDPAELVVSDNSTGPVGTELVAPATDPVATTVPVEVSETAAATTPDSAPISDDSTTTAPSPLPLVIPETLQGVWREVDGSPITADDCRIDLGFEENFGRVLTISESGFVFFESGGELIEVHDVDATRVEATFDTTVADTPTQDRITFDAPGDATVLIMSGDDRPGPTQYVRCPA